MGRPAQSPVSSSKLPDLFICKLYVVICQDERHILGLNLHPKTDEMKVLVDISKLVQDCTYAKLVCLLYLLGFDWEHGNLTRSLQMVAVSLHLTQLWIPNNDKSTSHYDGMGQRFCFVSSIENTVPGIEWTSKWWQVQWLKTTQTFNTKNSLKISEGGGVYWTLIRQALWWMRTASICAVIMVKLGAEAACQQCLPTVRCFFHTRLEPMVGLGMVFCDSRDRYIQEWWVIMSYEDEI